MDQDILGGIVVIVGILLVFAITALDRLKEKQAGRDAWKRGVSASARSPTRGANVQLSAK